MEAWWSKTVVNPRFQAHRAGRARHRNSVDEAEGRAIRTLFLDR
jgi:hypothetical protein